MAQGEEAIKGQAVGVERRVEERFPCDLELSCREQGSVRGEWQALRVQNISATGIGLMAPHKLRPGAVVVIRLASPTRGVSRPIVVRIMHATAFDGAWLTGVMFVRPLGAESLRELLGDGPAT
jgi:PilZ domain-containing protein